jgi:hypothetical protein
MSHWSGDSESVSVAGEFGRPPGGGPASLDDESVADSIPSTCVATPVSDDTFAIPELLSMLSRKDRLDELAIATPICGYA